VRGFAYVTVAVLIVIGIGAALAAPAAPGPANSSEMVTQFALDFAANTGNDLAPTSISWVLTNYPAAFRDLFGGSNGGDSSDSAYAFVVQGKFQLDEDSPPSNAGGAPSSGTTLVFIADPSRWIVTDFGVQNTVPHLSVLGRVRTVHATTIRTLHPETYQAWSRDYDVQSK
jgi:hypothetical protein